MTANNAEGVYDKAIPKQRSVLKFFMNHGDYRQELPDEEEAAAAA
jgi:hypothetical protein